MKIEEMYTKTIPAAASMLEPGMPMLVLLKEMCDLPTPAPGTARGVSLSVSSCVQFLGGFRGLMAAL